MLCMDYCCWQKGAELCSSKTSVDEFLTKLRTVQCKNVSGQFLYIRINRQLTACAASLMVIQSSKVGLQGSFIAFSIYFWLLVYVVEIDMSKLLELKLYRQDQK